MPARAVFLDRDNTLIDNDGDLGDPDLVRLLEGVGPALARLRDAGYRLVIVSNQGGVARGAFGEPDVEAVHRRIASLVDAAAGRRGVIDRFYFCPYHPAGSVEPYRREHPWRKPQPGMLHAARQDLGLDLRQSWLIGDQPRDVAAGRAAGCATILISADPAADADAQPTAVVRTIGEAADVILKSEI
ncbi:MAG: D-glycero-alpha-D-manno-heptose-1,7-bisphosphate 7-phosphatase [Planctomycetota bacterium]|jgi:D-glycero-D-manno-heptose 1,7-bisphosphate phosphatase